MIDQYRQTIVAILEKGVQTGEFKPVDADALAWMLMADAESENKIDMDQISPGFIEALMKGVRTNDES